MMAGYSDAAPSDQVITGFSLINASSGAFLQSLTEGQDLDLDKLPPNLAIEAKTTSPAVGSVEFKLNSQPLAGSPDSTPPYRVKLPLPAAYTTISAKAWTQPGAAGTAGPQNDLHLNIFRTGPTIRFADAAVAAYQTLMSYYEHGTGAPPPMIWHLCWPWKCGTSRTDWGADSLTYALYFRWLTNSPASSEQAGIVTTMNELNTSNTTVGPSTYLVDGSPLTCVPGNCYFWSDVGAWDSVASARAYQVTGTASALTRAVNAFNYVDTAPAFASGACPTINYQAPTGGSNRLKTMETDSNMLKASILLYQLTHNVEYLTKAKAKYAAIKQYFWTPSTSLYTVYVIDDGSSCTPIPGRYFASANGNMIWSSATLATLTMGVESKQYRQDAVASARAVVSRLSDRMGIFVNAQAENDVVEPLIEGMYLLAAGANPAAFAKAWLLTNASHAVANVRPNGTYGRFFGAPATVTSIVGVSGDSTNIGNSLESTGGFALAFAAAALDPEHGSSGSNPWRSASYVANDVSLNKYSTGWPYTITFIGRAITLIGTAGEASGNVAGAPASSENGHARVLVDGVEIANQTGIWQSKDLSGFDFANDVLFSWRFQSPGPHTLTIQPGMSNVKEGDGFLHTTGYYVVP